MAMYLKLIRKNPYSLFPYPTAFQRWVGMFGIEHQWSFGLLNVFPVFVHNVLDLYSSALLGAGTLSCIFMYDVYRSPVLCII